MMVMDDKKNEGEDQCVNSFWKWVRLSPVSYTHLDVYKRQPQDIVDFVVECVKTAGSNPCPPVIVGVGIGGDFELCAYLAKKALCRDISVRNTDAFYAGLEKQMLEQVNQTDVGPQGFGGDTTALAVNIEQYATHIAGLPVAVNMGCHVTRHAEIEL